MKEIAHRGMNKELTCSLNLIQTPRFLSDQIPYMDCLFRFGILILAHIAVIYNLPSGTRMSRSLKLQLADFSK